MKFTYLFAVTAALILAGCGSFTERPADSKGASGDVKSQSATDAENSVAEESSEVTADSSEVVSESSLMEESSEVTESSLEKFDESKADGKVGLFTGGLDDDGRGEDEEHFGLETGFAPGIWWSFCDSGDMYYEFATDGTGMRIYQADGFKEGFTYEMEDGCAVFSFAGYAEGVSENTRAKAEERGDGAVLTFDNDGHTEELVYMGNITFDEFTFYNNEQLKDMAQEYYKQHNDTGYVPEFCDILKPETGNDIVIHLFDIEGNHTATVNWYYIDRFTGKGKDMMYNEIDLTTALKG